MEKIKNGLGRNIFVSKMLRPNVGQISHIALFIGFGNFCIQRKTFYK